VAGSVVERSDQAIPHPLLPLNSSISAKWQVVFVVLAAVQLLSAALFLFTVHRLVFDENYYDRDVRRYEREGITQASLRAQDTAAGPGMTVLASLAGRLAPGSLVVRRIPILAGWVVSVVLLFALARNRPDQTVVPVAGILLLVFPHTPLSMATLLTEGPSLTWVVVAIWTSGLGRADPETSTSTPRALLTGLSVGLAIWFRQYYLALVPAFLVAWWTSPSRWRVWGCFLVGPLVTLGAYFYIWGGLTSTAARVGTNFGYQSHLGLDFIRPLSAMAYVGVYALPVLIGGDWRAWFRGRGRFLPLVGFLLAALVVGWERSVWGNGPLATMIAGFGRIGRFSRLIADGALTGVAFTGALVLTSLVSTSRRALREPFAVLCWSFILFFALEQAAIGGNVPYYERYAHQTILFGSALAVMLVPPRSMVVTIFIAAFFLESQWILWRNVLGV